MVPIRPFSDIETGMLNWRLLLAVTVPNWVATVWNGPAMKELSCLSQLSLMNQGAPEVGRNGGDHFSVMILAATLLTALLDWRRAIG